MNLYEEFRKSALKNSERVLVYQANGKDYETCTYGKALEEIEALAAYLSQLNLPFQSNVGLISENRYEWIVAYMASVSLGLVVVPLDPKLPPADWKNLLEHAEARLLFISNRLAMHSDNLRKGVSTLQEVIPFDDNFPPTLAEENKAQSHERTRPHIDDDDIASLIYTSGTTGTPKGVMLSHRNLLSNAKAFSRSDDKPSKCRAIIVPLNHALGFTILIAMIIVQESAILYPELDRDIILKGFADLKPNFIVSVPLFYQKIAQGIESQLKAKSPKWFQLVFYHLIDGPLGAQGTFLRRFKKLVFKKIHNKLGGRLEHIGSGGAALEPHVARLFNLIGIPVLEGYGLTETSPMVSNNDTLRANYRAGSVGKAAREVTIKIHDPDESGRGEICVRGPNVMKGYYKNPEATREVIDTEGWFHTGDLGYLDKDGFLFISGRKKDIIVTANGKNIYPEELEPYFAQSPLIKELCVFGINRRKAARSSDEVVHIQIVPNGDEAQRQGITDVEAVIRQEITERAETLPDYKRPRSISFSQDPFPRSSTMKVRKFLVKEQWLKQQVCAPEPRKPKPEDIILKTPIGTVVVKIVRGLLKEEDSHIAADCSLSVDLGLDSLTILEFWAGLEKAFETSLPKEKLSELHTVGQVIQYLDGIPEANVNLHATAIERQLKKNKEDNWSEILMAHSEENQRIAQKVLASYSRIRPLFLHLFYRFFQRVCRLRIEGLENLPEQGPFIIVPNHECHLDNLFVACQLPAWTQQEMVVIGKKEHFAKFFPRLLAKLCHAIPVDRDNVSATTLQICAQVLRQGKVLLVHPEGTRSPDGYLLPFKSGVPILAMHLQCPVVPVYIEGAHEFWPKEATFPKSRSDISVTIGKPVYPHPLNRMAKHSEVSLEAEEFTKKLQMCIVQMRTQQQRSVSSGGLST